MASSQSTACRLSGPALKRCLKRRRAASIWPERGPGDRTHNWRKLLIVSNSAQGVMTQVSAARGLNQVFALRWFRSGAYNQETRKEVSGQILNRVSHSEQTESPIPE